MSKTLHTLSLNDVARKRHAQFESIFVSGKHSHRTKKEDKAYRAVVKLAAFMVAFIEWKGLDKECKQHYDAWGES